MTDVWGAIQIPLQPALPGQPAGDPSLFYIGDFLKTYLTNDQNARQQWTVSGVAPRSEPVRSVIIARPDDKNYPFDSQQLPALFLFRDGGKAESWGDDWDVFQDIIKVVWVMPNPATPEQMRARLPFMNALVKCVHNGIELGRTPTWVQSGDPDTSALTKGSLLYTYAAFVHLNLRTWRPTVIRVGDGSGKTVADYPSIEMTFEVIENRVIGTDAVLYYKTLKGATDTVSTTTAAAYTTWLASTAYPLGGFVVPPVANNFYYVCTTPGISGTTAPVFPIVVGNTVSDGAAVWTCVGLVKSTIASGPLETSARSPV